ncbi:unnamed protein product [Thlaspi arvense]|uniref:PIPK domain-containing protein n=1 Tax=Thlaspi arvense TaxID=13288 RepID=A0AAU9R4K6_THLAR|nr:unnamed protein product [Thlaspi arvense]
MEKSNKYYMVMENLFYGRKVSSVYHLKGAEGRDTSGVNKVRLDMNLLEEDPIFIGLDAKKAFEIALWNDNSFLSTIDVMDYSLLVGMDEERKQER